MVAPQSAVTPAARWVHEYLIEEDEMSDSTAQRRLVSYLAAVLEWRYAEDGWHIACDLAHYHEAIENSQQMISPDIAVFKGIVVPAEEWETLKSWDMRRGRRACPPVMMEVSSGGSPKGSPGSDIKGGRENKPWLYGRMGVREYFAYDPNRPAVWGKKAGGGRRLLGWRYDATGAPREIVPDARGWLWSAELESWLGADGGLLRLYDGEGVRRLTRAEAEAMRAEAEQVARAAAEAQAAAERVAHRELEEKVAALQRLLREHGINAE